MYDSILHSGVSPGLSPAVGSLVLVVGAVVLGVVAYDIYRHQWVGRN